MSDLEARVRKLESERETNDSGCGCLFLMFLVLMVGLSITGHDYVLDNAMHAAMTLLATPTPGVMP